MFSQLQQKIFPIYFAMQTALPLVVLASHPSAAYAELLSTETAVPMGVAFLTSVVNMTIVGPATVRVMKERKRVETKEGKKYYDAGEKSAEMQALNKKFGAVHGISSLLNLVGLLSTVAYGATLGAKLVL